MATRKAGGVPPIVAAKKAELVAKKAADDLAAATATNGGVPPPLDPLQTAAPAAPTPVAVAPTPVSTPTPAPSPTPAVAAPAFDPNAELDFGATPAPGAAPPAAPDQAALLQTAIQALAEARTEREASAQREADMQHQIEELTRRGSTPPPKTKEAFTTELAALDIAAEELTPEEMENYSPATQAVIAKLVKKELARIAPFIKNANLQTFELANEFGVMRTTLGQPNKEFTSLAEQTARIEEEQFVDRMKYRVTSGKPLEYDRIVKAPAWKLFLTRPVKGGSTVAGTIQQMHANRDLEGIARVFSTFVSANPMESLAMPAPQSAPSASSGGAAPQQVTMKLSQLTEMQTRFQKKQIKKEVLDAFRTEFDKARAENRVDMNS